MSLLRNFSPGGSEPDDEQPTTAARPDEDEQEAAARPDEGDRPTTAQPDDTAGPGGGHVPGTARYAFGGPSAGAAPAPAVVVPSEVVTENSDPAPVPVAEAAGPETTPPDRETPVARDAPTPVFTPYAAEAAAPATAPVSPLQTTPPVPMPSPRATGEAAPATAAPDFAAPLLGDATELRARWQRAQGDFVDDPLAAVGDADDLVGQTAEALVTALRERQRQLRAAWQRSAADGSPGAADGQSPTAMAPGAPDTEQLRLMMQRYRALFNQLCRPS
jgi:hypothetical protein